MPARSIGAFINKANDLILNPIIMLLFGLAFIYFIYGIIKFLQSEADDKSASRAEARSSILWGIVGMLIMFSVYGIIKFVMASFGIESVNIPDDAKPYLKIPR